jgi:antitoxin (DNA-binding transcriptional repressor) of toxin-antitoxin stability system
MRVGTKELKNRLSHYLRLVQAGEAVQVTDRGSVVAELRAAPDAVSDGEDERRLATLEREGLLTRGNGKRLRDLAPLPRRGKKLLSEIVIEDRG